MSDRKPRVAGLPKGTRQRILDAAEHLLATDGSGFTMRKLASTANVSFATPFNVFGSKAQIFHALSAVRIERMCAKVALLPAADDAVTRVLTATQVAAAVMLEAPLASRAIMGGLGAPAPQAGAIKAHSRVLWAQALGAGEGLTPATRDLACAILPGQLAMTFRGVLSFWAAGEIDDASLATQAQQAAAALLLGFVNGGRKAALTRHLNA